MGGSASEAGPLLPRAQRDAEAGLESALAELYAWYADNAGMLANVIRDREVHELTRATLEGHMGPWGERAWMALTDGLPTGGGTAALLALALEFGTWRSLAGNGVPPEGAARLMAAAVRAAEPAASPANPPRRPPARGRRRSTSRP